MKSCVVAGQHGTSTHRCYRSASILYLDNEAAVTCVLKHSEVICLLLLVVTVRTMSKSMACGTWSEASANLRQLTDSQSY